MPTTSGRNLHDVVGKEDEKSTRMRVHDNDARQLAGTGSPSRNQRPEPTEEAPPGKDPALRDLVNIATAWQSAEDVAQFIFNNETNDDKIV